MTPIPTATIQITEDQKQYAKYLAEKIWEDKRGKYADRACSDTHKIGYIGYLGETIYADFYNAHRPMLYRGLIDDGHDILLDGTRVQVKTTTHDYPADLILFFDHRNRPVDMYALVRLDLGADVADIVAEVPKEYFWNNYRTKDYGYGKRAVMTFERDTFINFK